MATSQYSVLTLQLQAPIADPVTGVAGVIDLVAQPWLGMQQILDTTRSMCTQSQPSVVTAIVDGSLGALAPQATVTYASATGAQTLTIGGVAVPGMPAPGGANDPATAAAVAAAVNASVAHQLVCTAIVDPTNSARVILIGRWPGPGLNTIALAATTVGGTATVSAATFGGSASAPARAGVAATQNNSFGIGTPSFP